MLHVIIIYNLEEKEKNKGITEIAWILHSI